jgi:hypothetical protein
LFICISQKYYGKVLRSSKDLKTSACTAGGRPHPLLQRLMARLPQEVTDRSHAFSALQYPQNLKGRTLMLDALHAWCRHAMHAVHALV